MNHSLLHALIGLVAVSVCMGLGACRRSESPAGRVVLYYSVDDVYARPIIEQFERETGIRVDARPDNEATKTTGLVQRLRLEREHPVADVFWSSEPFMTEQLAIEGVLSDAGVESLGAWPRPAGSVWYPMALRARVLVYNTRRVEADAVPAEIRDLLDPRWKGRIVMARPAFGTTRGHMAALVALWGAADAEQWLRGMESNGARLVDGNSAVVRAVATGEADIGLTDTDDVWAGLRNGWPVALVYLRHSGLSSKGTHFGVMTIPTTVARVSQGPNPDGARRLIEYLVSEKVERTLAESDSHNFPVSASLRGDYIEYQPPDPMEIEYARIVGSMEEAMRLCRETIGE